MHKRGFVAPLIAVVGVSLLLNINVQADEHHGQGRQDNHYQHSQKTDGRHHDGYSGASRRHNDGRHDGFSGATPHDGSWDLTPEQHRALRNFERQKQRDYRRLGQQRFSSDRQRQRAYRELRERHHNRLSVIVGKEPL